MALKVKEAEEELDRESYVEIQGETAWKWGSRAAATYEKLIKAKKEFKLGLWTMAEEYYHEAVEHAALVEDEASDLVKDIQKAVRPYQDKAFKNMESTFDQDLEEET